ncbi:hypothetical protein XHV734_2002 [Xanthomonas hortorum pv. vitians]|nr:hypothetical protein XHV734_2002 [Xanthomonas hortorum pv. vitians]
MPCGAGCGGTRAGDGAGSKHCKDPVIADDAPDDCLLGLVVAAALIATRQSIAAINRIRGR